MKLLVNGVLVDPVDPLYLRSRVPGPCAQIYGKPIEYSINAKAMNGSVDVTGTVRVVLSELPIQRLASSLKRGKA